MRALLLPLVIAFVVAVVPTPALAAKATFFGPIIPPECNCEAVGGTVGTAADWGCVLQTVQNGMNFALSFSLIIFILVLVYVGAMFVISPANPGNREMGRTMITNVVIGAIVVASAWLLVDFVMKIVYNPSTQVDGKEFGPWNEILKGTQENICVKVMENPPAFPGVIGGAATPPTTGTGSTGTDSGSQVCTISTVAGNPCSVATLSQTCFKNRPNDAAQICYKESAGGNPAVESGSDKLNSGRGPSYSIGLWQINLTVHPVGSLDCPKAFSAACKPGNGSLIGSSKPGACRSTVINQPLYSQCVAAAKVAATNSSIACKLYQQAGGFQPWVYSANKCQIPLKGT